MKELREIDALVEEHIFGRRVLTERFPIDDDPILGHRDDRAPGLRYCNESEWGTLVDMPFSERVCEHPAYEDAEYEYPRRKRGEFKFDYEYEREVAQFDSDVARFGCSRWQLRPVPYRSTAIAPAWEIAEKIHALSELRGLPCELCVKVGLSDHTWVEVFELAPMGYAGDRPIVEDVNVTASTVPLAICLAALEVFGVKV